MCDVQHHRVLCEYFTIKMLYFIIILLLPDYILGPDEDLSGVVIDDDAGVELEMALTKTRKLRQKKKRSTLADRVLEAAAQDSDEDETPGGAAAAIILNETSEFCRSLGDIPSYGMAGNRDEEEMDVRGNTLEIMFIWSNLISQIIGKQCDKRRSTFDICCK